MDMVRPPSSVVCVTQDGEAEGLVFLKQSRLLRSGPVIETSDHYTALGREAIRTLTVGTTWNVRICQWVLSFDALRNSQDRRDRQGSFNVTPRSYARNEQCIEQGKGSPVMVRIMA